MISSPLFGMGDFLSFVASNDFSTSSLDDIVWWTGKGFRVTYEDYSIENAQWHRVGTVGEITAMLYDVWEELAYYDAEDLPDWEKC